MKDIIIWVGILVILGMIFKYLDQKLSRINYREAFSVILFLIHSKL